MVTFLKFGGIMHLEQFINQAKETYGDNLKSITLFGSAASEDFSKKYSDYNLIFVLDKLVPAELKKSTKLVQKWTKSGNSIPLFFDEDHIKTSTDVFPIEFYDIKSNRKILYGNDPFKDVEIHNGNLRHQCESELKGKILQLQSKYVEVANKDKEIARLMMESFSAFLSIFKGIVRLVGKEPDQNKRALVEQLAAIINFSPNIFMELLDIREGKAILPRKDTPEKFEDYLEQLKEITNFVDKFST